MPQAAPLIAQAAFAGTTYSAATVAAVSAVVSVAASQFAQMSAEAKAKRRLQNEIRTRNITIRSGMAPRTVILGTARSSGPIMYAEFVGPQQEFLDSIVAVNAGELASIVGVYIGDEFIAAADITSQAPTTGKYAYTANANTTLEESFTVTAATSVTLAYPPDGGVVLYVVQSTGSGQDLVQTPLPGVSVAGSVVSWTGAVTGTVIVGYPASVANRPISIQWAMGSASQATTTWAGVSTPKWTSNHRLRGVAYIRTLKLIDHPLFIAGDNGDVGVVAFGPVGVWDPRSSTYINGTSNPALLAAWFRMQPVVDGGFGVPFAWIDWATVAEAANVCDELISVRKLDNTGYENVKRYECNTRLSLDRTPEDNLRIILDTMAGDFPFTGGFYKCFAGAFRSATVTLTDDDVASEDAISYAPAAGLSVAPPNIVTGNFYDKARNWVKQPAREVENTTYVTADGGQEMVELDLEGVTDERQANYLMGVYLERARPSGAMSLTVTGKGANLALLDTVQLALHGCDELLGKTFEVRRRANQWNGRYPVELREVKSSSFTLDADRFTAAAAVAPPDNDMLFSVADVADLTAVEEFVKVPGGLQVSRVRLEWTQHTQAYVLERGSIQVRWRIPGSDWVNEPPVRGSDVTAYTAPVAPGVAVACQVRAVNGAGAAGAWAGAAPVVISDLAQYAATDVGVAFAAGVITRSNII